MTAPSSVLIVGESVAGTTAARELRALGHRGRVTILGAEAHGAYSRPPLSKAVLRDAGADATLGSHDLEGLDLEVIRSPATGVDLDERRVTTTEGPLAYDALIVATGAAACRLARPGQRGELVLRTLDDARRLRSRLETATSAIVVGAGFLGMEVATACAVRGIPVTVVDVDRPLRRVLGPFLSEEITALAERHGIRCLHSPGLVTLAGDPVQGVVLGDGTVLTADLVVTCAGDVPATGWLEHTGLADRLGVGVDDTCATGVPGVYAAGDVTYLRGDGRRPDRRAPFWSNAVVQGKVAAATTLGREAAGPPVDDYFWTEILGVSIKVVGPLPLCGEPTSVEGELSASSALLTWHHPDGGSTVVAYGVRKPVPKLRALAGRPGTRLDGGRVHNND